MYFDNQTKLAQIVWHSLPSPGTPTQLHQLIEFFNELYAKIEFLEDAIFSEEEEA
jgi:hypothetical protein